jgi:uncharacterized protein YbjT (DUF2867 family)
MKIAITGGTGFVGGHLARALVLAGHEVVLIARGVDEHNQDLRRLPHIQFVRVGISDKTHLVRAFAGCHAVAHCAGINREIGTQTYQHVHVEGTHNVVQAAQQAGVKRVLLTSFLRARPHCGAAYHESKWAAEEIVRSSGLDYTILKAGVVYGKGDHMLDHLSRAFATFPVFALVGIQEQHIRPVAVEDLVAVIQAALLTDQLSLKTVCVLGPEELTLSAAVRRVAAVVGKRPLMFRLPVVIHYALSWCFEQSMIMPLVSMAQIRMLSEGIVEPLPFCEALPDDLLPKTRFTLEQIRKGLPEAKPLSLKDCRCLARLGRLR